MSTDAPRRIVRLSTTFWVPFPAERLPAGTLERAATTCPVHQSLHPEMAKPVVFHWADV
jgi:putative redox protein